MAISLTSFEQPNECVSLYYRDGRPIAAVAWRGSRPETVLNAEDKESVRRTALVSQDDLPLFDRQETLQGVQMLMLEDGDAIHACAISSGGKSIALGEPPFMLQEDGVTNVYVASGKHIVDGGWRGVCVDARDAKAFWYLGWDYSLKGAGERSFNKLSAATLAEALHEGLSIETEQLSFQKMHTWRFAAQKGSLYMFPEAGGVSAGYEWLGTTDPEVVGLPESQSSMETLATRFAACANACRGMADPGTEISQLKDELLSARKSLASMEAAVKLARSMAAVALEPDRRFGDESANVEQVRQKTLEKIHSLLTVKLEGEQVVGKAPGA